MELLTFIGDEALTPPKAQTIHGSVDINAHALLESVSGACEFGIEPEIYVGKLPPRERAMISCYFPASSRGEAMTIIDRAKDLALREQDHEVLRLLDAVKSSVGEAFNQREQPLVPRKIAEKIFNRFLRSGKDLVLRHNEHPDILQPLLELLEGSPGHPTLAFNYRAQLLVREAMKSYERIRQREVASQQMRESLVQLMKQNERDEKVLEKNPDAEVWYGLTIGKKVSESLSQSKKKLGTYVFFDLNGFKAFNDGRSYNEADKALVALGIELWKRGILTGRFAGDEFICFFPDNENVESCIQNIARIFEEVMLTLDREDSQSTDNHLSYSNLHACFGGTVIHLSSPDAQAAVIDGNARAVKLVHDAKKRKNDLRFMYAVQRGEQTVVESATGEAVRFPSSTRT